MRCLSSVTRSKRLAAYASAHCSQAWGRSGEQPGAAARAGRWPATAPRRPLTACAAARQSASDAGSALAGRVYLVTGSTDGIGQHTAQRLAAAGAAVVLHGRQAARVAAAVERVRSAAPGAVVHSHVADLSELSQVRRLADEVAAQHERIDVLINNAGVYEPARRLSADGFELTWAVNVLAPFLLTRLLLPRVSRAVVNTASISAAPAMDLSDLQGEWGYSAHSAYSLSKACNIAFTRALAVRLAAAGGGGGVTTVTLDPGTVNTKMLLAGWGRIGMDVGDADNTFALAADDAALRDSGAYYIGRRPSRPPACCDDPRTQDALWALWEQQTGGAFEL